MVGPRRSPAEALAALAEAMQVIRTVWSGERNLRLEGRYYRLHGAHAGPLPAHPIGIWLGAYGRRALQLTGRSADGWVPSFQGDWQVIADMARRLDDAATAADRAPGAIRRILNVNGAVTKGASEGPFHGPPDQWVDELTRAALELGFDTFIFWGQGEQQLEHFAEQVVPSARERVARERRDARATTSDR